MIERFGVVIEASKDKGPFMLIKIKSEGREFWARVQNPSGIAGSPRMGSLVTVHANADGGMEKVTPHDLTEDRFDSHKEGEVTVGNTKTKSSTKYDEDGTTTMKAKKDTIIGGGGIVHINPP